MDSDEHLLARFLKGEDGAFEALVTRYEARLRNLAFGLLRDRALAEDVAQDAFLQAYRKAASFKGQGTFRGWLYRIAINRAQDELRRRKRKREVSWDDVGGPEDTVRQGVASVEDVAARRELDRQLARALAAMRKEHRTPLVMREVEGMTYQEISRVLGWPLGTVQTRIHRARLELRSQLKKWSR
ncbi:MAG: RNA polymerase sigma factor [Acidobacteriota bacterium]